MPLSVILETRLSLATSYTFLYTYCEMETGLAKKPKSVDDRCTFRGVFGYVGLELDLDGSQCSDGLALFGCETVFNVLRLELQFGF